MLQRVISSGRTSAKLGKVARDLLASLNLTAEQKTAFGDSEINESANANRWIDGHFERMRQYFERHRPGRP